jgi:hypothetical protein
LRKFTESLWFYFLLGAVAFLMLTFAAKGWPADTQGLILLVGLIWRGIAFLLSIIFGKVIRLSAPKQLLLKPRYRAKFH